MYLDSPQVMVARPSAIAALEKFSGVGFEEWNYKLKAVCFQLGLGDLLLHPDEWTDTAKAMSGRVHMATYNSEPTSER